MNSKTFRSQVVLLIALVVMVRGVPGVTADFTADLVISKHNEIDTMKILVSGYNYRLEDFNHDGQVIMIRKKGVTWALEPGSDQFRELDTTEEALLNPVAAWENLSYEMRGRSGRTDTIGDYECEIFVYNYPEDSAVVLERWYASELNFIIKQILNNESGFDQMELLSITPGELDGSLFDTSPGLSSSSSTDIKPELVSVSSSETATAPAGRRISAGGELRVTVDPARSTRVKIKNLAEGESTCRITLFRDGEPVKETGAAHVNAYTLTYRGERKSPMFGSQLHVDELVARVDLGIVEARVEPEPSSFDDTHLREFYLPCSGGQFVVDTTRSLEITLTGDSQDGPVSTGKIVVGTGEYVNSIYQFEPIEEVEFALQNGASQTWNFQADKEIKDVHIRIDDSGALKVKMWQPH